MGGVFRLFRGSGSATKAPPEPVVPKEQPPGIDLDGALDALGAILRSYGKHAFDLDTRTAEGIAARCEAWARHALTAAPLPENKGATLRGGLRSWASIRLLFDEQRVEERRWVLASLATLRSVLWKFVQALREAFTEDARWDAELADKLAHLLAALKRDSAGELALAAEDLAEVLGATLERREARNELCIAELGQRLVEIREQLHSAREEAETDALTGVPNRAAFDKRVAACHRLFGYTAQPETLLLLDIDHFKVVNDRHGHPAGDAVLRGVGDVLSRVVIRKSDFVARYGGEEFAVVLTDTDEPGALRVADRLIEAIRSLAVPWEDDALRVTVSIGVCGLRPGWTLPRWVKATDAALYQAKEQGRDRVVLAEIEEEN